MLEVRHALRILMRHEPIVSVALEQRGPLAWRELQRMRADGEDPQGMCGADHDALCARWNAAHKSYRGFHGRMARQVRDRIPALLARNKLSKPESTATTTAKLTTIATPFVRVWISS